MSVRCRRERPDEFPRVERLNMRRQVAHLWFTTSRPYGRSDRRVRGNRLGA